MRLLSSWAHSLQIFKPRNFISFIKSAFGIFIGMYKKILHRDWWLIALVVAVEFVFFKEVKSVNLANYFTAPANIFWIFGIPIFSRFMLNAAPLMSVYGILIIIFLDLIDSSNPHPEKQKSNFLSESIWQRFYYLLWLLVLPFVWKLLWIVHTYIPQQKSLESFLLIVTLISIAIFLITAFNLFFAFFLFDSSNTVDQAEQAFVHGWKMVFYSIPFCIIMGWLLTIIGFVIWKIHWFVVDSLHVSNENMLYANTGLMLLQILIFLPMLISICRQFYVQSKSASTPKA